MTEEKDVDAPHNLTNQEIDLILSVYPDEVADAMQAYKTAETETKRVGARRYLQLKAVHTGKDYTETHIKNMVQNDPEYYCAQMAEIVAETKYTRLYETLLSAKKLAGLRTAY